MAFPSSIPSYTGFTSSHTLQQDSHAAQHNQEQADVVALATKMGTGSSTPSNATLLRGTGTGTSAWAQVSAATDVTGILSTANGGTGVSSLSSAAQEIGNLLFPVGCIYTSTSSTNPGTSLGFGTWTAFGAGRVLVGNGTSDQAFTAGTTGGESNHVLTQTEMPSHTHTATGSSTDVLFNVSGTAVKFAGGASGLGHGAVTVSSTGSDGAHNNLQPYVVVYFWQRTA